jgi:hypothetical protein
MLRRLATTTEVPPHFIDSPVHRIVFLLLPRSCSFAKRQQYPVGPDLAFYVSLWAHKPTAKISRRIAASNLRHRVILAYYPILPLDGASCLRGSLDRCTLYIRPLHRHMTIDISAARDGQGRLLERRALVYTTQWARHPAWPSRLASIHEFGE